MGRKAHCSSEERRLVLRLRGEGKTYKFIAEALERTQILVTNALKPTKVRENRGRPKKTSAITDPRVLLLAKSNPFASSRTIGAQIGNEISTRTIRRRLQNSNLPGRLARKVPLLRANKLRSRKEFAVSHKSWNELEGVNKWHNILWSDETKINLFSSDSGRNVRRTKGKDYHPCYTKKTVKHGGGIIMVWGCFSWYSVGPIFRISNIMTKYGYREILENVMLPFAEENMPLRWHFQQDNDPKHTAGLVKDWFRAQKVSVIPWPSQSPDLNPIENLWDELKKKLGGQYFTNRDQLWEAVQKEWHSIPLGTCQKLVDSMPLPIQKVLDNNGGHSGY